MDNTKEQSERKYCLIRELVDSKKIEPPPIFKDFIYNSRTGETLYEHYLKQKENKK